MPVWPWTERKKASAPDISAELTPLIAALGAMAADTASALHKQVIVQAWQRGQVRLEEVDGGTITGTRISISGDNTGTIIVGHNNVVLSASSAMADVLWRLIRAEQPHRLHQLPPEEINFKGREREEQDLLAALQPGSVSAICALNGMGGIGKSALAARVGWQAAERFPYAQLWIRLNASRGTSLQPVEAMTAVIRALEPLTKIPEAETEVQDLYRNLLHKHRCLIVFDDAKDANQLRPLLPPAPSAALITSRQTIALGGMTIKLPTLSPAEVMAVLRQIMANQGRETISEEELALLAEGCRYLPLALQAAGAFLGKRESWTISQYLAALPDQRRRMTQLFRHSDDETLDVYAILGLSVERLREDVPETAHLWQLLSVFPATFDAAAAAAVWERLKGETRNHLDYLVRMALLEVASHSEEGTRFRLHDFFRDIAEGELSRTDVEPGSLREISWARFAVHFMVVLGQTDERYLQGGDQLLAGLALYDLEADNIVHGHALAMQNTMDANPFWLRLIADYADAGAYILHIRLHPRDRITWLEAQRSACRQLGDRRSEGTALGNMGNAYRELGQARKAITYYERWLAIAREVGDRRSEGIALSNMGNAYVNLGESRKVIALYEQSLAIAHEIGERRSEGIALSNMGNAYVTLGEPRKAIALYEQSLAIVREIGDRRGEGAALGNMGLAYAALGDAHSAIAHHEQQLAIAREIGSRWDEGYALGNMGLAYSDLDQAYKALELYEQQLEIVREIGNRRGEAQALANMAVCLKETDDSTNAIAKMEASLMILTEIESPHVEAAKAELEIMRQKP